MLIFSLRSLVPRERILILFRGQKPRFFGLQIGHLSKFLQGLGPPFGVAWAENEARSCFGVFRSVHVLAFFLLFDVLMFSWNWFSLLWQSTKRNAVPVQTGLSSFDPRRKRTKSLQSTCIQDDLRFDRSRLLVCSSLILDRAWLVWSGCEMKCFCCITGTAIIYSFHEYYFESP